MNSFDYETVVMGKSTGYIDTDYRQMIARDVRLNRLFTNIPRQAGNVLDIGCGGGTITNCIAFQYKKAHVYGCDVSKTAVTIAQKSATRGEKFAVIKHSKFPYKTNTFDLCVCFDVLEHVPDVHQFMRETKRVLKSDGRIFFAIPCEGEPWSLTWWLQKLHIGDRLTYKHVGHIHPEFTHEYIRRLFQMYGFDVQRITYSEHFVTQCLRFIRFILPKELLERMIGTGRAEKYYDRSIVRETRRPPRKNFFMYVREIWLRLSVVFDAMENTEDRLFAYSGFAAWKMIVLATKKR